MKPKVLNMLKQCSDRIEKVYSLEEIAKFESGHDIAFPEWYKALLTGLGAGSFDFGNKTRRHLELYKIEEVISLYEYTFDEPEWVTTRYWPFAYDEQLQEEYVIVLDDKQNTEYFARIFHEYAPEEWDDPEIGEKLKPVEWFEFISESDGDIPVEADKAYLLS